MAPNLASHLLYEPEIRVVVLTGVGHGFCSGADMKRNAPADRKSGNFLRNRNVPDGENPQLSKDARETRQAFLEKRKPVFKDR